MYKLSTNRHGINIPVEINGKIIQMELDRAEDSIISKETFHKHFKYIQLESCTPQFHTYTGDPIRVCGQFSLSLKFSNQWTSLPLLVVEGSGPSLFGRDLLAKVKLEWEKIFSVADSKFHLAQETKDCLDSLLQTHSDLFEPGLGTIKAKLQVKTGAQPKFCKVHPVPYALKPAVEDEYNHLEAEGIIEKVEFSEWATTMVHIPKADQTTQSCGDYAVTVNPQLNVPQYPIPLPEDVFQKLRRGKLFTKLDLRNAYQQLLIDEGS